MFSRTVISRSTENYSLQIERLKCELESADAFIIGVGAGLSDSAGFSYSGVRFRRYFSDFEEKYVFRRIFSFSNEGRILGLLEPSNLSQPL